MTSGLISRAQSQLLVVDIQGRLHPAMSAGEPMLERAVTLLRCATALAVPVLMSEQYPKGLGPTVPEIVAAAPSAEIFSKMTFSCARDPGLSGAIKTLRADGRDQIVICGIEAHVCVAQTALDLAATGAEIFVVADAIASRRPQDRQAAVARFGLAGITVVTTEMVVFEWLERAGSDEFRSVSALLKPL